MKSVSEYKVIGTSYPMPGIRDKVTGQTQWSCDVTLPGMLHARMVRPPTMGSTLITVGEVDKKRFPTAEVVRKGNVQAGMRSSSAPSANASATSGSVPAQCSKLERQRLQETRCCRSCTATNWTKPQCGHCTSCSCRALSASRNHCALAAGTFIVRSG